ncbi:unnamed protein product [Caenorhabditis nigoni]
MITWQWICFAVIILVANGSENQETDHCGNEEKSSTPPTTTTMEPTTTACRCSKPPVILPFTNDKYTDEWWSNIKNETQSSYNSSFFVDTTFMTTFILEDGCSVLVHCYFYLNGGTRLFNASAVLVTSDDQRRIIPYKEGYGIGLLLDCNNDGQYTYEGAPFDAQVAACVGVTKIENVP